VAEAYHAGKGDEVFLYCDKDTTALTFSWYDATYESIVHREPVGPNPFDLTEEEQRKVENRLIKCPCGGRFLFKNPLRCPMCCGVFSDPPRLSWSEVVVVMDRHIDGNKTQIWKEPKE
jgi:hypothetical protein